MPAVQLIFSTVDSNRLRAAWRSLTSSNFIAAFALACAALLCGGGVAQAWVPTATTISSDVNPSVSKQTVTITATVTIDTEVTSPGGQIGTVGIVQDEALVAEFGLNTDSSRTVTYTTSELSAGTHTFVATFRVHPSRDLEDSTSPSLTQTVNKRPTATRLLMFTDHATPGGVLDGTVEVDCPDDATIPSNPYASVSYFQDGVIVATGDVGSAGPGKGGYAYYSFRPPSSGKHTYAARFNGDAYTASSMSDTVEITVDPKVGPEFRVNTVTANSQITPAIGYLNTGFIAVWASKNQDGSDFGIFSQQFGYDGGKLGLETRVNTATAGIQSDPAIAMLKDGGWVVVWISNGQDGSGYGVYGQRFNDKGRKIGREFRVNTTKLKSQVQPSVAALSDGSFVVSWTSPNKGGELAIYAQRFTDGGAFGSEFLVSTQTSVNHSWSSVAAFNTGGFVVVWQSEMKNAAGIEVSAQIYSSAGKLVGAKFRVNKMNAGAQSMPSVATLKDGSFVVVWQSDTSDGNGTDIQGQRFSPIGARLGNEFRVNMTRGGNQTLPSVAGRFDGKFVITWTSDGQDGSGLGVYARLYTATGAPAIDAEYSVNTRKSNDQFQSVVTAYNCCGNEFVILWTSRGQDGSQEGIYGQLFQAFEP